MYRHPDRSGDGETLSEVETQIDANIKMFTQSAVSEMSKENFEEQALGGLFARAGAKVFSVEGEKWTEGLSSVEGVSFLGHFIKADEFIDGFRIWFTKKGGYFYKGTRKPMPKGRRIPHPLSKSGYYVPRDGGLLVYDNGNTLLLSKSGIFTGKGGWGQAKSFREKWMRKEVENQQLQDRIQHTTSQLNHTESQLMRVSVSKDDIVIWAMKMQDMFHNARDTLTYMRGNVLSLHSQIEGIQSIKGHQEQVIKRTLTDIKKQMDDLQTFVMNERIFESITMAGAQAPDIRESLRKKLKDSWKREGILPEDKQDKEMQALKQKMEQQDKEMQALRDRLEKDLAGRPATQPPSVQQQTRAPAPSPPPDQQQDEDSGDDEGEDADEGDGGEDAEDESKQPPLPKGKKGARQTVVTDEPPKGIKEKVSAIGQEIKNAGKKSTQKPRGDDAGEQQGGEEESSQDEESDGGSEDEEGDEGSDEEEDEG